MNELKDLEYLKLRRMLLLERWAQILEEWKQSILDADIKCDYAAWHKSLEDWNKSTTEYNKEKTNDA